MEEMQAELNELEWDTKAPMRGRVVNKRARFNLCFADHAQEPDYENYKGRIIPWEEAVLLGTLRNEIQTALMLNPNSLVAEGNLYYDPSKCGIGFHGDAERRLVVGVRIGEPMKLCYEWYHRFERIGERFEIELDGGDLYVMGDKAVGHDWKKSSILTLRHAAGCAKYTK
jgi:alkylated DNA repair dioxygenase AlkB